MPAIRWFYRQRMEAVLTARSGPGCCCWMPALRGLERARRHGAAWRPCRRSCRRRAPPSAGIQAPKHDEQTIRPDAKLLFVAGAGWTKKQADGQSTPTRPASLILASARAQASLGSSKSLVDLSGEGQAVLQFMTHLNQIGQTGATPRHPKGLSTCCHGEEPHVVGWRFINERRAINLDPNCGWARGKADVLYVADAFAVMARVNALMAEKK